MEERRKTVRRPRRAATALAAGFLLATFAWPIDRPPPPRPPDAVLVAEPVALDGADRERRRLGGLVFLEGWHLASSDVRFGGISAMHVEGAEVIALSDSGSIFRFSLPRRAGALRVSIRAFPHGPGSGRRKSDRDSEALAIAVGRAWVAFEGRNSVWRFRLPGWEFEAAAAPAAMAGLSATRGPEAMVRLQDGRFLLFAEGPRRGDGTVPLLLFEGDPSEVRTRARELRYRPPEGFRPTDAALLPDGRLMLLNRNFSLLGGWEAALTVAPLGPLSPGAVIEGREVAALKGAVTTENFEALSVTREGRRTIVWIASDDNFNPLLQRTLLMKFALAE